MKHILLLVFLVLSGLRPTLAQPTGSDSLSRKLTAIFAHIDKSRVPSGILEEYGLQLSDHLLYTGANGFTDAAGAFPSRA